jgi:hypothetical protein
LVGAARANTACVAPIDAQNQDAASAGIVILRGLQSSRNSTMSSSSNEPKISGGMRMTPIDERRGVRQPVVGVRVADGVQPCVELVEQSGVGCTASVTPAFAFQTYAGAEP